MRSLLLSFLFALCLMAQLPVQAQAGKFGKKLVWSSQRPLSWPDFAGRPEHNTDLTALTSSDIDVKVSWEGEKFKYQVTALFDPSTSWAKQKTSARLLAHEQLHFDITEIHARMLRKALSAIQDPRLLDNEKLGRIVNPVFEQWKKMEDQYDHETNHGLDAEAQLKWKELVAATLLQLEKAQ